MVEIVIFAMFPDAALTICGKKPALAGGDASESD